MVGDGGTQDLKGEGKMLSVGQVLVLAMLILEVGVVVSLVGRTGRTRLVLRAVGYFLIWGLIVAPLAVRVLAALPIQGYSTAAQTKDFILSLPLQWWAVRIAYVLVRVIDREVWLALRWVVLRGLGVTESDLHPPIPPVPASFLRNREEQEVTRKDGFQFSGQYSDPERWTV
jgi:hypothetical protein